MDFQIQYKILNINNRYLFLLKHHIKIFFKKKKKFSQNFFKNYEKKYRERSLVTVDYSKCLRFYRPRSRIQASRRS